MASVISKGAYLWGLSLDDCKMSRFLHLPTRILKVYLKALTGFLHIHGPESHHHITISRLSPCLSGQLLGAGDVSRTDIHRTGEAMRSCQFLDPAQGPTNGHIFLKTSPSTNITWKWICSKYFKGINEQILLIRTVLKISQNFH